MIPPLTRGTGAPRVIGVGYPMGLPLGLPGDDDGQRRLLSDVLHAAAAMDVPRSYTELPHEWSERRSAAIREPSTPPPIAQLLTKKPWLVSRLITGKLPSRPDHHDR
ncbi:MAG: hypothetical protein ACR2NL_04100 [Acidimicrobiia bacterium]